jgi:replicative DNA helicase
MECPVIVLSQLSRGSVQREGDKRPLLSDLRDSGSIEQDADVVIFLHREDYFKKAEAEPNNICEVIIAKQRQGETGTVNLTWMPRFQKFADNIKENKVE